MRLAQALAHPRQHPTQLSYVNGFAYGLGMGMLMLLVPLYVLNLGFDLADLGLVVSSAAVFLLGLRLAGAAVSDRFGERIVIWFSFGALLLSSLVFVVASTLLPLIVAQLVNGASRSVYWSAGQSYTSRSAEGRASETMGRLLSFESTGGILGAVLAGGLAQFAGFEAAFLTSAGVSGIGIVATTILPSLPRKDQARSIRTTLAPVRRMVFQPSLGLAHYTAFMAAGFAALTGSLFTAFFHDVGYGDTMVGVLRSVSGIGVVAIAYPFGTILARLGARNVAIGGIGVTGAVTILTALTGNVPGAPLVLMAIGGLAFGSIRVLYTAIAAQYSAPNERATALAVTGLFWAAGMLVVPYAFGLIGDAVGIRTALYIHGGIALAAALVTPLLTHAWGQHAAPAAHEAPLPDASA